MKRRKLPASTRPVVTRVPYPQSPTTAKEWCRANGVVIADLARLNNLPRLVLVDLLRGQLRGHRGLAHQGAIVLGLKPDPAREVAA